MTFPILRVMQVVAFQALFAFSKALDDIDGDLRLYTNEEIIELNGLLGSMKFSSRHLKKIENEYDRRFEPPDFKRQRCSMAKYCDCGD